MKRKSVATIVCGFLLASACTANDESVVAPKRIIEIAESEFSQQRCIPHSPAAPHFCAAPKNPNGFAPLFPDDGVPTGWTVRHWADVSKVGSPEANWKVRNGILQGSTPRGTWLMSEREYGDFELKFDFKLGPRGNSGCALRAPLDGDPAFDGIELQMADLRYNPRARPSELTGGLYRAVAPTRQVYQPTEWNTYHIILRGPHVTVNLNRQRILDLDLNAQTDRVSRHDGSRAPALKDRPRHGHIGFQELSRGGDNVQIRNATIRELTVGK